MHDINHKWVSLRTRCADPPKNPWQPVEARSQLDKANAKDKIFFSQPSRALLLRLQNENQGALFHHHLAGLERLAGAPLAIGNAARLLVDGPDARQRIYNAIRSAQDHINLETYNLRLDRRNGQLAELLLEKQAQGVQINLIYDSVGCRSLPTEFIESLRQSGANVVEFNPIRVLKTKSRDASYRDHRRILIVDGTIAFTGAVNLSGIAPGKSRQRRERACLHEDWRDTHIEIRGPAVAEMQRLFHNTWHSQCNDPLPERDYFPVLTRQGNKVVRVIGSSPDNRLSAIYMALYAAVLEAQRSIHLKIAYFAPDPLILEALKDAARRGVDVKLILPGCSDAWAAFHAGRSHYPDLLKAGIEIFEHHDAVRHAKTAVIDGVWSTIGSTNRDWCSFLHNDEASAIVLGETFALEMEHLFEKDQAASNAITLSRWRRRGVLTRWKQFAARTWAYWS